MEDRELIERLKQASLGLLCHSEADYPFETIYWEDAEDLNSEKILRKSNQDLAITVEVKELDRFFEQATAEQDWYNQEEMAECKRYQALVELLQNNLTNIKVYRVGEVEISVYILGTTQSGAIAGLSTKVVET